MDDETVSVRVLIVDDDAGFRRVAAELCRARRLSVVGEAVDVRSALAAVAETDPDWVLMDVNLPDGSGLDASREITSGPTPPGVLLTSSETGQWTAEDVQRAGASAFVRKDDLVAFDLFGLFSSGGTSERR